MIIGSGSIASAFINSGFNYDKFIVFASGVSNSKEIDEEQYKREYNLIKSTLDTYTDLVFIYFTSVLSSKDSNRYYKHKYEMEELIVKNCKNWIIFSIPQIISAYGNKQNFVNFLKDSIYKNKQI